MTKKPIRMIRLQEFKAISHAISTYDDFPLMINHFVEAIIRAFNVKGCSLLLLDESENQLFHVRSHEVSEEYLQKGSLQSGSDRPEEDVQGRGVRDGRYKCKTCQGP